MMNPQHADQQLVQLAHRFNHWRQCRKTPRERIPEPLWDQAVSLSHVLPVSRVAKRLGLCTTDLKRRCANNAIPPSAQKVSTTVNFVEVTASSSWRPASVDVAIQRRDGTRMHMAYPQHEASLATLIRAFVEARSCSN